MVRPPIRRIGLSPPPIRRASPPASRTPGYVALARTAALVVTVFALALVPRRFLFDEGQILVEDDALLRRTAR